MSDTTQSTGLTVVKNLEANLNTLVAIMGVNMQLPAQQLQAMALQEIQYVGEHIMRNPALADCTPESILICVRKAIKNNLTLDPDAKLMYMIPGSVKTGRKKPGTNYDEYVKVLESPLTVNGALSVAYQCGSILDHERPKATYDSSGKCTGVTVRILRPSHPVARWEQIEYDQTYFDKWKAASHKKNARTWNSNSGRPQPDPVTLNHANELYTSFKGGIDPEFAIAKGLRHALGKLGTNANAKTATRITISQDKQVDTEAERVEVTEEYIQFEETENNTTATNITANEL